ncbi:MAG TPA: sensor domain-containing protein, partial [Streptosporangiaceae bacterium]
MMDVGEAMVWGVRHTLRTCLRGMALAVTAVAGLPLLVASVICILLLPTGLGVLLAPKSLLAVRRQAERQRRWAREWSGVTIAAPYRTGSTKPTNRLFRVFRRCGWVLG